MNRIIILAIFLFVCCYAHTALGNDRINQMLQDVLFKPEDDLIAEGYTDEYSDILHLHGANVDLLPEHLPTHLVGLFLETPTALHVALATNKLRLADLIITTIDSVRAEGWDKYDSFRGVEFPLTEQERESRGHLGPLPSTWLEHQHVNVNSHWKLDGLDPLMLCVLVGSVDCVNLMITHNHNVNLPNKHSYRYDALIIAVETRQPALVSLLLSVGAWVDMGDRVHLNVDPHPLHSAVILNDFNTFTVLLDAGVSVDVQGRGGGDSVLHVCAEHDRTDMAAELIKRHANIQVINTHDTHTPLSLAKQCGSVGVVGLLEAEYTRRGVSVETEPSDALRRRDFKNRDRVETYISSQHNGTLDATQPQTQTQGNRQGVRVAEGYALAEPIHDPDLIAGKAVGGFAVKMQDGSIMRGGTHSFRDKLKQEQENKKAPTHPTEMDGEEGIVKDEL